MGVIIDESDDIDMVAEWADRMVNSSIPSPRRREAAQRKLMLRRRIEEIEDRRRLKALLGDDYPHLYEQH